MKKKKHSSLKSSASPRPNSITLSDADFEKLSKVVTKAILDAEQQKAVSSVELDKLSRPKTTAKDILRILFIPVKKLKIENSALSLVRVITSMICWLISRLGYFLSIAVLVCVGSYIIKSPGEITVINIIYVIPIIVIIWMISRLIDAAGVEIESTNNDQLIFGLSAFLFAIISIAISLFKEGV